MSGREVCSVVAEFGGPATAPSAALGGPSVLWFAVGGALIAAGLALGRRRRTAILVGVAAIALIALHTAAPATAVRATAPAECSLLRLDVTAAPTAEVERLSRLLPGDDVEWSRLTVTNTADRAVEVTAETRILGSLSRHLTTHTTVGGSTDPLVLEPGEARPVRVLLSVPPLDNELQGRHSSFAVTVHASAR